MGFSGWRVRKGSAVRRFSDGSVLEGCERGVLELLVCRELAAPALPHRAGLLWPIAAACTSEGIRRDTGAVSWLHWPNLVTFEGRVLARTWLSTTDQTPVGPRHFIFTIAVDCFARPPTALAEGLPATSILEVLGVEIDVRLLREKVLHALDWYLAEWEAGRYAALVKRIEPTISWLGRKVTVPTSDGEVLSGRAKGLDESGSLILAPRGEVVRAEEALLVRPAERALRKNTLL